MKLHDLKPAPGSRRRRRRVGRGISAGQGKTSGRGQKGQFARTAGLPKGFEGGQMPLSQRLPKLRGFHNRFRKDFSVVNVGKLNRFEAGSVVDADALRASGLASPSRHGVKVLGSGRLRVGITLRVHRVSASARAAVEKAGGRVELLGGEEAQAQAQADAAVAAAGAPVRRRATRAPRTAGPDAEASAEPPAEASGATGGTAAGDTAAGDIAADDTGDVETTDATE